MIVDSHNHLWHIATSDLYWMTPEARAAGGPLVRDFLVDDLKAAFAGVGVDRSVLVQAWHSEQDNLYWLQVAEESELIGAVVAWVDLTSSRAGEVLDRFAKFSKFKGVRACGEDVNDPDWLGRDDVLRGIREVAARGDLSLDLLLKIPQLKDVPLLAELNPDLPMVLDHLAKPQTYQKGYFDPWAKLMGPLAKIPNLSFKISGMLTEAGPGPTADRLRPAVRLAVEQFGFERLMWGSDWPVCLIAAGYKTNFDLTMSAVGKMSAAQRDLLLGGNAQRFYRIATA